MRPVSATLVHSGEGNTVVIKTLTEPGAGLEGHGSPETLPPQAKVPGGGPPWAFLSGAGDPLKVSALPGGVDDLKCPPRWPPRPAASLDT